MSKFADIDIDPGIIRRAARGDVRAHEIIYRAFATPVYSLCLRFTRVPAHAEDLVQDVFSRAFAALDQFRGDASVFEPAREYARRARAALREITSRGRLPLVVGGTGLYLRALLEGLFAGPSRHQETRRRLETLAERYGDARLHRILCHRDPEAAARIRSTSNVRSRFKEAPSTSTATSPTRTTP